MANNLTAAQRAAFARDSLRHEDFIWTVTLEKSPTVETVTSLMLDYGSTEESLVGWHDRESGEVRYPLFEFVLNNADKRFSQGSATDIWAGTISGWYLTLKIEETLSTGAAVTLVAKQSFLVVDVELVEKTAVIRAQHPLAGYWAKMWMRADRHAINWNGQAHQVSL